MRARAELVLGLVLALSLSLLLVNGNSASATGTTFWVNDDNGPWLPPGTSCEHPGYKTIQAAVTAAPAGTRINVCPGTYVEQVQIAGTTKNGIQLRSTRVWQAIIKSPTTTVDSSLVRISGARDVTILAFTITGPRIAFVNPDFFGVRVDSNGSANILGNHITNIRDEPFNGGQHGVAVQVGRAAEAATGQAKIIGNVVDNYQKNGVTISNTGSSAEIAYNRVLGVGPTAIIAQNGIQVSSDATAKVVNNFVANNVYTPATVVSTGMLFFSSGVVNADHNTLTANDVGVYSFLNSTATTVSNSRVRASTFEGIILDTNHKAFENRVDGNGGPGIALYDGSNNSIYDNVVEKNKGTGILLDTDTTGSNSNKVNENRVRKNGSTADGPDSTDGIRINAPSTSNTIRGNRLDDNVTHDCHDGSTGNTWQNNEAETSMPPNICPDRDDEDEDHGDRGWHEHDDWQTSYDASDLDYTAAYATVDTESLLQLLPQLSVPGTRRAASPNN